MMAIYRVGRYCVSLNLISVETPFRLWQTRFVPKRPPDPKPPVKRSVDITTGGTEAAVSESKKMKALGLALLLAQVAVSLMAAAYAVAKGIPYYGIGPMPWWQYILSSPWFLWFKVNRSVDPLILMVTLSIVYTVIAFLIIHYLIMKPILRKLAN